MFWNQKLVYLPYKPGSHADSFKKMSAYWKCTHKELLLDSMKEKGHEKGDWDSGSRKTSIISMKWLKLIYKIKIKAFLAW